MPIVFVDKRKRDRALPEFFLPYVREWFYSRFKGLTPPQQFSFRLIHERKNALITAPTGSGKTLAGFLTVINELFRLAEKNKLEDRIYCLYVSPLKALNNDIKRNLEIPLAEIREIAEKKFKKALAEIRVAVRTGDVTQSEKARQLKKPPHILITTPESLAIMLNAPKFREMLKTVKWVIVDEIHELASSKRGVHLSLSLERLRELTGKEFVRIGLGATLHPLEEAAKFLVGYNNKGELRDCVIVDVTWEKPYDLKVLCPVRDLIHISAEELNDAMYELLDKLIENHRTTLIFTNTRSGTERVVYHLKERWKRKYAELADSLIGAHHGSLSREVRLEVEEKLKRGELKAVVCSTSLELGIDIGYVDLVVQLGSPKSVTRAVQRIGRSGHKFGDIARGRIIALDRDDLVETSVMLACALKRKLDKFKVPKNCLDVLAQHIVGMALEKKWKIDRAFRAVKRSYCYHELSKEDFLSLLRYLSGSYVDLRDRSVYGKIWLDEETKEFGRRGKYTRVIYYLNLGTIPDEVKVDVYLLPGYRYIGGLEEDFLERLKPGDIFVLGGKLYYFVYARGMRCYVKEAPKEALPTIPSWFSEMLPLSFELAEEIRKFREVMRKKLEKKEGREGIISWIMKTLPVDANTANAIYLYFKEQHEFAFIPKANELLVEHTEDLHGRRFLVFHALFGRKVNDALSRALALIIADQIASDVLTMISDNGFALLVPQGKQANVKKAFEELFGRDIEEMLKKNVRRTELMLRRFRHCAARSFLVLRNYKGHKISVAKQQTNAQTLLRVCERIEKDFPVIKETYREILYDVMDLENAKRVLEWMKNGKLKLREISTPVPSPFAHNLILLGESDVILMADRKKRLLELYEAVLREIRKI